MTIFPYRVTERMIEGLCKVNFSPGIPIANLENVDLMKRTNKVKTSKYSFLSFIPKNLFLQFHRTQNIYFLILAISTALPFSPISPIIVTAPLLLILLVNAIKEAVEDIGRHRSDASMNAQKTTVWDSKKSTWRRVNWSSVKVGSVIRVYEGESFPADIILLTSSDPHSIAYVETSNLDGEANLKQKSSLCPSLKPVVEDAGTEWKQLFGHLEYEQPNADLYSFRGTLGLSTITSQEEAKTEKASVPIGPDSVLLRGTKLEHTKYVTGVTIYVGHHTKVMMNASAPPSKMSSIELRMNRYIFLLLLLQAGLCISLTIQAYLIEVDMFSLKATYLPEYPLTLQNILGPYLTFLVLFGALLPVSLFVTLEILRAAQAWFFQQDKLMYDEATNTRMVACTSNLNEDLGRVEYLFSDKTGTLTQNQMQFRLTSIAGKIYRTTPNSQSHDNSNSNSNSNSKHTSNRTSRKQQHGRSSSILSFKVLKKTLSLGANQDQDQDQDSDQREVSPSSNNVPLKNTILSQEEQTKYISNFYLVLSLCNSVRPYNEATASLSSSQTPPPPEDIRYFADSPDEQCLVEASRDLGYFLYAREPPNCVYVNEIGVKRSYEVLATLEFSAARRRMTVIIRDESGGIKVLTKGADSAVLPRLSTTVNEEGSIEKRIKEKVVKDMERFARQGLRTLVFACRELSEEEFTSWFTRYERARLVIKNREEEIERCADEIESSLTLLGASGVEDKLQDGVERTISRLLEAGIRFWVLTGDKMTTAISVGYSSGLFSPGESEIATIHAQESLHEMDKKLRDLSVKFINEKGDPTQNLEGTKLALVLEGGALSKMMNGGLLDSFLRLSRVCESVTFCRASPLQKALLVSLIRKKWNCITLAIGDGANDVTMIQTAHIGVGISGKEGRQAVNNSDYAIGKFEALERLLLVHGYWSYERTTHLILYSFYKSITANFAYYWFLYYCGFSGQVWYDGTIALFYNIAFTSWPVIIYGLFNQRLSAKMLLENPSVYKWGQSGQGFNLSRFLWYILWSVIQSTPAFFIPLYTFSLTTVDGQYGTEDGYATAGLVSFTCLLFNVTLVIALDFDQWTWIHHFMTWGSLAFYFGFISLYSAISFSDISGVWSRLLGLPAFYLCIVVSVSASILPLLIYRMFRSQFYPSNLRILQEIQKYETHMYRKGERRPLQDLSSSSNESSSTITTAFSQVSPVFQLEEIQ